MIVALTAPVLIGAMGLGTEVGYWYLTQRTVQSAADAAAYAAATRLSEGAGPGDLQQIAYYLAGQSGVDLANATVTVNNPPASGAYATDPGAVEVIVTATVPRMFSAIYSDGPVPISASAVAAWHGWLQYEPPKSVTHSNEAGDFNEMYAYCFDYEGGGPPESRRSQMTLIANNMPAGSDIMAISGGVIDQTPPSDWADSAWPVCGEGESLSFRLRNIRHAKSEPDLWANPDLSPYRPEHNHYTDTTITDGAEQFNLEHQILETVRCDTYEECNPDDAGNILPSGAGRDPEIEAQPCLPGKFMYFAWEDRPYAGQAPESGSWTDPAWTDLDYDDIRIVMECPETGLLGDGYVRLVR